MKTKILQMCPLSPDLDAALQRQYQVISWQADTANDLLAQHAQDIRGIATAAPVGVPGHLIEALPALQVISCRGVGLDKIDLAQCRARGIQVAGTFGTLSECVADLTFALLLDVVRQVGAAERFLRAGQWTKARYPLTTRVSGKRLGILGLGQIGREVARRASGFSMQIAYTNRSPVDAVDYRYEPSLQALAEWCDFLVVCVSGSQQLVTAPVLDALGPQGYLVNIARGSVIDEPALIQALQDGRIAGAGLDVFINEPEVPQALLSMGNVVLTPHIASGTTETRKAMEDLLLENLDAFFSEGSVRTPA